MQAHEYFEELSALAAIGQLSAEEHKEFYNHLRVCSACRQSADEFVGILDQLPVVDPPRLKSDEQQLLFDSARRRFLTRAANQGVRFSPEALGSVQARMPRQSRHISILAASVAAAAACILAVLIFARYKSEPWHARAPKQETQSADLNQMRPSATVPTSRAAETRDADDLLRAKSRRDARSVEFLKRQLAEAAQRQMTTEDELQRLRQQLEALQARHGQDQQSLALNKRKLEQIELENARNHEQTRATLESRERSIEDLKDQLAFQSAEAERERELSAVGKDVREMMGAQNLHIIDVYDVDTHRRRENTFGRVFYIPSKLMIFYTSDLHYKGSGKQIIFQAWGQGEGKRLAKSLGVFRLDQGTSRWVLRVNDPRLLSNIDSVFVTVEPFPGRDSPTGKKLLYAYLNVPANHP